jgi:flagellar basal body-associated protein FliL
MSAESVRLRETMTDAARKAERSGNIMIVLTVALVMLTIVLGVLTYVLVAAELGFWPFVAQ